MAVKDFENLSSEEKACLKHMLTGQIRNVLANEFGLNRENTGQESIRWLVKNQMSSSIRAEMERYFDEHASLNSMIKKVVTQIAEKEVKAAVSELIKKQMADVLEDAVDRMDLQVSLTQEPKSENPNYGSF